MSLKRWHSVKIEVDLTIFKKALLARGWKPLRDVWIMKASAENAFYVGVIKQHEFIVLGHLT